MKQNRNKEVAAEQAKQKLVNAAKIVAYAGGLYNGGWLVECSGHIDGFSSDYLFVHSNPGNITCHKVYNIREVEGMDTTGLDELMIALVKELGEQPSVPLITVDEVAGCKTELKQGYSDYCYQAELREETAKTSREWLDGLLEDSLDEETPWDTEALASEINEVCELTVN